ncbi:hypothetical protein D3C78_1647500 [compost metagenome]
MLSEEVLHGPLRQLDAQHLQPLASQPEHIQALAAQGHQHPLPRCDAQCRPVLLKVGVDLGLMKADLIVLPARMPKLSLHA